jgi:nicotinamide-nucleotide amidase
MSVRAGVVVTGTEVLTGRVRDENGPWLADRLFELGIDLAHITICGDRPEDMEAQLRFMAGQGVDLIITSGGLGPTADDLTLEVVARFCGRKLVLDERLEALITKIVSGFMRRFPDVDREAVIASNRKQALLPEGAAAIDPAGTAPGVVVTPAGTERPVVVVLPGPPRELQAMWPEVLETQPVQRLLADAPAFEQRTMRLFGIPEAAIAETLRKAEERIGDFDALEITTCLRRGEVEVVVRHAPEAAAAADELAAVIAEEHPRALFSPDGQLIDDQIAGLLVGATLAVAESCTGGMLAARITDRPGASPYFVGGVVAYSDESKTELLGVDPDLIEKHGAVSPEVADAMADGALERFGADYSIAITGVAGPDGGTEDKPVGYVCWSIKSATGGSLARDITMPGDRHAIRERSTTVALHLLRRLLTGEGAI